MVFDGTPSSQEKQFEDLHFRSLIAIKMKLYTPRFYFIFWLYILEKAFSTNPCKSPSTFFSIFEKFIKHRPKLWTQTFIIGHLALGIIHPPTQNLYPAYADVMGENSNSDLDRLKKGLKSLNYLIDNWDKKTTYCNFGEFKRELLDVKNKDELLIAANEGGMLDKSKTMNVLCKRDPEVVRAFLGLTDENILLSHAEALMRSPRALSRIDPDRIDLYIDEVEKFTQAVASADSLAYNARTDYSSTENFSKSSMDQTSAGEGKITYLSQSKISVMSARDALADIVNLLNL
jgi:hypothetical protein